MNVYSDSDWKVGVSLLNVNIKTVCHVKILRSSTKKKKKKKEKENPIQVEFEREE